MNITALARRRAEAAARLEALAAMGQSWDAEENREMAIATSRAVAAYREAEESFQRAISTMTVEELAALGLAA